MKKAVLLIFSVLMISGCATVGKIEEKTVEESESRDSDEIISVTLFDIPATVYSEGAVQSGSPEQLIYGRLAEGLKIKNDKAELFIPRNAEIAFDEQSESYIIHLGPEIASVKTDIVEYEVHNLAMFNKDKMFRGFVAGYNEFKKDGKKIVFLRDDSPVWASERDFDYSFFSVEYRDSIEYDILLGAEFIEYKDLENQFEAHDGYGMQIYGGESFFVKIGKEIEGLKLIPVENEETVLRNFKAMNVGRPYVSSYTQQLVIPLSIRQPEGRVDGRLELIAAQYEAERLRESLGSEDIYLVFRMGLFSDFDAAGHGILYFVYNEEQYNSLMNRD